MQDEYSTPAAKTQVLIDIAPNGKPRPWRARHRQGLMLSEVYSALGDVDQARAAVYLNKAKRLESCAQVAEFRRLDDGSLRLHSGSFCRVRLCPMCQWRRSLKLGAQVRQVVERANANHIKDTGAPWRWLMVTYTVRNVDGPDLAAAIDTIHKGLNNMTKCARWRGAVRGWLRATEVTHNTNEHSASYDTFHPHMHMLLCVPAGYMSGKGYIRQKEWAALWGHYVKADYTPVVDIRVIKPEDGTRLSDLPAGDQAAAMGKACAEVSKYAAKPADYIIPGDIDLSMSAVQVLDAMLDKRRMTAWGGILKDVAKSLQLDDIETGDLVHIDEDASADYTAEQIAQYVTYNWHTGVGDYTRVAERAGDTPEVERKRKRADRAALEEHSRQESKIALDNRASEYKKNPLESVKARRRHTLRLLQDDAAARALLMDIRAQKEKAEQEAIDLLRAGIKPTAQAVKAETGYTQKNASRIARAMKEIANESFAELDGDWNSEA